MGLDHDSLSNMRMASAVGVLRRHRRITPPLTVYYRRMAAASRCRARAMAALSCRQRNLFAARLWHHSSAATSGNDTEWAKTDETRGAGAGAVPCRAPTARCWALPYIVCRVTWRSRATLAASRVARRRSGGTHSLRGRRSTYGGCAFCLLLLPLCCDLSVSSHDSFAAMTCPVLLLSLCLCPSMLHSSASFCTHSDLPLTIHCVSVC